jgi:hypothetical protein
MHGREIHFSDFFNLLRQTPGVVMLMKEASGEWMAYSTVASPPAPLPRRGEKNKLYKLLTISA